MKINAVEISDKCVELCKKGINYFEYNLDTQQCVIKKKPSSLVIFTENNKVLFFHINDDGDKREYSIMHRDKVSKIFFQYEVAFDSNANITKEE